MLQASAMITYPSFRQVKFVYGPEHQLTAIRNYNTGELFASAFGHHESGALSDYITGNSPMTSLRFDAPGHRISSIAVAGLHQLLYDCWPSGNVREIEDVVDPGKSQSFTDDALDRLRTAVSGSFNMQFDYDAHGNRQTNAYGTYVGLHRFPVAVHVVVESHRPVHTSTTVAPLALRDHS
jgi:hypothetical protein